MYKKLAVKIDASLITPKFILMNTKATKFTQYDN